MTSTSTSPGTSIKAVIFDVGGVLIRTEDRTPRAALEASLGLEPGQADEIVFNSPQGRAAQLGRITSAELWAWVQEKLGLDEAGLAQFRRAFFAGDQVNWALVTLAKELATRYRVAILSNFMDDLRRMLVEDYPIGHLFDPIVISAEEGIMKPDAAIYRRVLERLGCRPEEAVFIDDFAHNVEGARGVGLRAIHYRPGMDVGAELARWGVHTTG